uniref:EF-hand domain-containing protein n=1 Tax=Dunaliella tertiolecta TaxID=3047 RepID=A0A7S3QKT9_DUNTE|mmetsp:Transcript_12642/g.34535  ORF Transcript_12642/g.34535 Transcript_12642/m.34535 type:complete len:180 (+) Transcript_12642:147-686(+)
MGQASSSLTQYDMEELIHYSRGVFNQAELGGLYKRFRALDRGRKGYLSGEEFLLIPELSINPLAQRIVRMFEAVNFKEFVRLLSAFSIRAERDNRLAFMFAVYDVDGDGLIGREDMALMLRQLAGSSLSEEDLGDIVTKAFQEAGPAALARGGLDFEDFQAALADVDLDPMAVEMPREW